MEGSPALQSRLRVQHGYPSNLCNQRQHAGCAHHSLLLKMMHYKVQSSADSFTISTIACDMEELIPASVSSVIIHHSQEDCEWKGPSLILVVTDKSKFERHTAYTMTCVPAIELVRVHQCSLTW